MAYPRRRYSRYSRYNRRRYTNRSRYTRSNRRFTRKKVYNRPFLAKRLGYPALSTSSLTAVTQLTNNGSVLQLSFNLAQAVQYTDFTNLYNEYKIRAVSVRFIPLANVSNLAESAFNQLIYTAIDVNGEVSTPTQDQIRQYSTVKYSPYNRIHKRYFYPRPSISDNMVLPGKQPWLSTSFTNPTQYQSLLISPPVIPDLTTQTPIYKVECTYYLSFRTTK